MRTIFTGGSGVLGKAMKKIRPGFYYPASTEMDVTNFESISSFCDPIAPQCIVHAAAFTSPPAIDHDPMKAIDVNIMGTCNIGKYCLSRKIRLIYISTDYVFPGDKGNYSESDPVLPVNLYAWSKLGGECAVRLCPDSLIIRTTFGPEPFPYEKAFIDQWTSRQGVSVIASKIAKLVDTNITGVIHVGGSRRSVYEYALSVAAGKTINQLSIHEVSFKIPTDTSLNCDRYINIMEKKNENN